MNIELLRMTDNSNAPALKEGDIVFVGRMKKIGDAGLYVIRTNGEDDVVRAQKQINGQVCITQDNVKRFEMKLDVEAFNQILVGKVLWICRQEDYSLPEHVDILLDMLADREGLVKKNQILQKQLDNALEAISKAQSAIGG